jgi:hypothetical protein
VTTISPPASPPAGAGPAAGRPSGRLPMTPGRGVALVLGVPVVLTLIALGGYSIVQNLSRASFPVPDTALAVRSSGLAVNLDGGNATVRGDASLASVAHLSGTVSYTLARPSLQLRTGDISLSCPWIDGGNCDLSATVDAPERAPLKLTTGGGDLSVSGLSGAVSASTDGGNVTASRLTADVTVSTGGGDVTVSQLSGTVSLHTDGGNITGTAITSAYVSAATGGGDITLTLTRPPRDLTVSTDGGNVTIVVPGNAAYDIVQEYTAGGSATKSVQVSSSSPYKISATSGGGDINIEPAS